MRPAVIIEVYDCPTCGDPIPVGGYCECGASYGLSPEDRAAKEEV